MKQQIFLCLSVMIFCACNNNGQRNNQTSDTSLKKVDITKTNVAAQNKTDTTKQIDTLPVKQDTLITVHLKNNKGSVRGYLSGIGKHVTIIAAVQSGDSITAQLIPDDDKLNIRFNQIYIPVGKDGKYDGPFSRTISYPVTVKGNYKLIVGSDLMAEGKPDGNFLCNVQIK